MLDKTGSRLLKGSGLLACFFFKMFHVYLSTYHDFRVVLIFVLENDIKCKVLTDIKNFKDYLGFEFSAIDDAEAVTAYCCKNNICFNCE